MILENEDIILDDNNVLDVKGDVVLYLYGSGKVTLNIGDNSMVTVYHVGVDICNNIVVNLNGDNSQILYNYDVVNYNNNKSSITMLLSRGLRFPPCGVPTTDSLYSLSIIIMIIQLVMYVIME